MQELVIGWQRRYNQLEENHRKQEIESNSTQISIEEGNYHQTVDFQIQINQLEVKNSQLKKALQKA